MDRINKDDENTSGDNSENGLSYSENEKPKMGLAIPSIHPEKVRNNFSLAIFILLGITIIIGGWGFLSGREVESWGTFTSPLFTLAASVITYYFKNDKN